MLRRPRGLFQLDDVALAEVGQRFGIGADGQHERHIMLLRVLFEAVEEPLRVGEVNLDQLEERVDEDGLDVVVGCRACRRGSRGTFPRWKRCTLRR